MPAAEEIEEIEIRSEEVQEILSHIPSWIIRWGITAILGTVLAIIISSWFIKYPDNVSARIILTTQTPPAKIIARTNGNIDFWKEDDIEVKKEDILGVIENPANTEDIFYIKKQIDALSGKLDKGITQLTLKEELDLGGLQSSYASFLKSVNELRITEELNTYTKQIQALEVRIRYYEQYNRQLTQKKEVLTKDFTYADSKLRRDSTLYAQNASSDNDFELSMRSYLQDKNNLISASSSITQNKIQIEQLKSQINDLRIQQQENETRLNNNLQEAFEQLGAQLVTWEQQFLLKTPIDGKITFSKYWSDNQYVNPNEEVMTIIPETQDIFGQVMMPVTGSGKVKIGQKVNIKFDNYPSNEFGMIEGKVESISAVPRDNLYTIRVSLPNGLTSSYKKELEFKQEMQGSADIITEDLRLIERVFNQFRSLIDNAS